MSSSSLKRSRSQSIADSESTGPNKRSASEDLMLPNSMGSTLSRAETPSVAVAAPSSEAEEGSSQSARTTLTSLDREESDESLMSESVSVEVAPRPSGSEQLAIINDSIKKTQLIVGETWFIVARPWYRKWSAACIADGGGEQEKDMDGITFEDVGPIDNSPLLDANTGALLRPPTENVDAQFMPEEAWLLLYSWYGLKGKDISRKVISYGESHLTEARIEFFPPRFTCFLVEPKDSTPSQRTVTFELSAADTIDTFRRCVSDAFDKPGPTIFRAYRIEDSSTHQGFILADQVIEDKLEVVAHQSNSTTLRDADLDQSTNLAIEFLDKDNHWLVNKAPRPMAIRPPTEPDDNPTASTSAAQPNFGGGANFYDQLVNSSTPNGIAINQLQPRKNGERTGRSRSPKGESGGFVNNIVTRFTRSSAGVTGRTKGVSGLSNLGNTCFMNSALQCLSNTPELRTYFTSLAYKGEINKQNPLGMSGAVAEAFGDLIKQLWSGRDSSVRPQNFKTMIGRFRPMFIGWNQQDSQEFLSFLLDGLHEDLNRILNKPATVKPEWEGGGDLEMVKMANESWEKFKMRNDSVIVDLFQGMYRSTVVCPDCEKISITFDAFTSLTLPLPAKPWLGAVFVVHQDPSKPISRLVLRLPKDTSVRQVKKHIGQITGIDPSTLFAYESFGGKMYKRFKDSDSIVDAEWNCDPRKPADIIVFCEMKIPYAQQHFRRAKEASDAVQDAKAGRVAVPVFSAGAESRGTYNKMEFFGNPLMLALEASDPILSSYDALYEYLVPQLAAQSKVGGNMYLIEEDEAEESVRNELDNSQESSPQQDPLQPQPQDASQSQETPIETASSSQSQEITANKPFKPLRPRPDLFRIMVTTKSVDNIDAACHIEQKATVFLKERLDNDKKEADRERASTPQPPGGFIQPTQEDDEDLNEKYKDVDPSLQPPAATTSSDSVPSRPIVKTGDSIVLIWSKAATEHFFSKNQQCGPDTAVEIYKPEKEKEKSDISLDSCLTEFSRQEKLDADNTWYCPTCKEFKEATKQVDLWSLPDILVIHLKRFSAAQYGRRDKISDFVDFPLEGFDLTDRTIYRQLASRLITTADGKELLGMDQLPDESMIYDLFAVDNHYGGMGGGHYTAYAKNSEDGLWYNFDDSSASPVSDPEKSVKTSAAYLLFYRRRSNQEFGGKTVEVVKSAIHSRAPSAQRSEDEGEGQDTTMRASKDAFDSPPYEASPAIGPMNYQTSRSSFSSTSSTDAQGSRSPSEPGGAERYFDRDMPYPLAEMDFRDPEYPSYRSSSYYRPYSNPEDSSETPEFDPLSSYNSQDDYDYYDEPPGAGDFMSDPAIDIRLSPPMDDDNYQMSHPYDK